MIPVWMLIGGGIGLYMMTRKKTAKTVKPFRPLKPRPGGLRPRPQKRPRPGAAPVILVEEALPSEVLAEEQQAQAPQMSEQEQHIQDLQREVATLNEDLGIIKNLQSRMLTRYNGAQNPQYQYDDMSDCMRFGIDLLKIGWVQANNVLKKRKSEKSYQRDVAEATLRGLGA